LGDMQHHVLTEHMQKGDYQIPLEKRNTWYQAKDNAPSNRKIIKRLLN
jgi:hypothetical protein